ncbi:hypothetical protein INT46_007368 [Mucor plumbeus]|uniref:Transposase n=1 Tax=Mucor plumbeus TaxID=97098 RepID=A0A8H7UXB5_9FUNG|nr:hypothetical protein INT46_007368 [Mucor plumbeus]
MRQAGVSKSTVYRIKNEIGQTFQQLKPGKPTEDTHKFLNNLGHPIGYEATRKLQHRLGFNCHIKKKQPHLNVDHRKDRLKWAKAHRICDGIQYTWKEGGQPDQSHNIKETRRHQKSLMVWGCMTSLGVGYACRVYDGTMKAVDYVHILSTTYKDTLAYYDLKNKDVVFQQDDWPAQSPDLNPIEHLWHHVKIRLGAYETPAKNVKELWERFDYEWNQFTIKDLEPYYNSMPDNRVLACIKNKGGNTGY